jgi:hypothetical protein
MRLGIEIKQADPIPTAETVLHDDPAVRHARPGAGEQLPPGEYGRLPGGVPAGSDLGD